MEHTDEQVIDLYKQSYSCRVVSEQIGTSGETVRRILIRNGISRRKVGGKTERQNRCNCNKHAFKCKACACMLYRLWDTNMIDIANAMGSSQSFVFKSLCDKGIHEKYSNRYDADAIKKLAITGMTSGEIAKELGYSQSHVSHYMREMGLGKTRDQFNAERHEASKTYIPERIKAHLGDSFEIVGKSGKSCYFVYELKCNECGNIFSRSIDVRYKTTCPHCEARRKEEEYWNSEFKQLQIVFPKEPRKTKDMYEVHECRYCGERFTEKEWVDKYGAAGNGRRHTCCSPQCSERVTKKDRRVRQGKNARLSWRKIMKRDGNICKLCGKPTDETDFTIDDNGHFLAGPTHPSSDHIIPLEKGGEHTYENAQLAHFLCNAKKGAKIEVSA